MQIRCFWVVLWTSWKWCILVRFLCMSRSCQGAPFIRIGALSWNSSYKELFSICALTSLQTSLRVFNWLSSNVCRFQFTYFVAHVIFSDPGSWHSRGFWVLWLSMPSFLWIFLLLDDRGWREVKFPDNRSSCVSCYWRWGRWLFSHHGRQTFLL